VQEIKVDPVSVEAAQTALARSYNRLSRRVVWINFAYQKCFVSPTLDRFGNQLFRAALSVHFGRID
jgi:hypothetical protein